MNSEIDIHNERLLLIKELETLLKSREKLLLKIRKDAHDLEEDPCNFIIQIIEKIDKELGE